MPDDVIGHLQRRPPDAHEGLVAGVRGATLRVHAHHEEAQALPRQQRLLLFCLKRGARASGSRGPTTETRTYTVGHETFSHLLEELRGLQRLAPRRQRRRQPVIHTHTHIWASKPASSDTTTPPNEVEPTDRPTDRPTHSPNGSAASGAGTAKSSSVSANRPAMCLATPQLMSGPPDSSESDRQERLRVGVGDVGAVGV